ncbi:MAG: hypothetical protein PVF12_05885 [Thiohalocapsa sp.]|jgi:hypothetical protein
MPHIDIRICNDGGQYTVQRVERPKSVAVEKTTDGRLVALRIDDADGVTTLVRRAGQRPSAAQGPRRRARGTKSSGRQRHHRHASPRPPR